MVTGLNVKGTYDRDYYFSKQRKIKDKVYKCPGKQDNLESRPGCVIGNDPVLMEPTGEIIGHSNPPRMFYRCPRCGVKVSYLDGTASS